MAYRTQQIAHIWAHSPLNGVMRARAASTSFEGDTLYSYRQPIARFARNAKGERLTASLSLTRKTGHSEVRALPVVLVDYNSFSVTTSRHQSNTRRALGYGHECIAHVFEVFDVRAAPSEIIKSYISRILDAEDIAKRARVEHKKEYWAERTAELLTEAEAFAKVFKLRFVWKGGDAARAKIKADAAKASKARAKASAERAKAEQERRAQLREQEAFAFRAWLSGDAPRCPYSWDLDANGSVYLRRVTRDGEDLLETSRGAEVPWAHAVRVFRFIQSVRATGEAFHANGRSIRVGHFRVDTIDCEGNMTAGCHRFTWARIAEIAKAQGVFDLTPSTEAVETT